MNNEQFIDVDYTEEDIEILTNELEDNKLYLTTGQAAKILGVSTSKLIYYTNFFKLDSNNNEMIKVETSNGNRMYSKDNIKSFKYLMKLINEDGMKLQQAKDYTTINGFNAETKTLDTKNPLALTAFIEGLTQDIDNKLETFQEQLLSKVVEVIEEKNTQMVAGQEARNQALKQEIAILTSETVSGVVNEIVADSIKNASTDIEGYLKNNQTQTIESIQKENEDLIEELKQQSNKMDKFIEETSERYKEETKLFNELRNKMDERKETYEKKKGLFGFFKK